MLQPHEDPSNDTLVFECSTCHHVEKALTACIYRNSLKEDIAETPGNVDDVLEDPTVGNLDPSSLNRLRISEDDDDEEEEDGIDDDMADMMEELRGQEIEPTLCTMCGQDILCPTCHRPTDRFLALEVSDPGPATSDDVKAEAMERESSRHGKSAS